MLYNAAHTQRPDTSEALNDVLIELKAISFYLSSGLNVPENPTTVRNDVQNEAT